MKMFSFPITAATGRTFFHKSIVHILLIACIGLLAYANTFKSPFVFDDIQNIVDNPLIKDIRNFTDLANCVHGRSVGYFSFALNYRLHGLNVTGYHIVNLIIHIITGLLVYWLLYLTFRTPYFAISKNEDIAPNNGLIALFSALIFVAHPIQTEAVTYIVQRFTSLATLFYLLSLIMYIMARLTTPKEEKLCSARRISCYLLSIISAILAMMTKEIAFTLPIVIALYEFMFFKRRHYSSVFLLVPLFFTALIIPLALLHIDRPPEKIIDLVSSITRLQSAMPRWDYFVTQLRVIVTYLRLLLFPIDQNLVYDYPVFHSIFTGEVFASFILLLVIVGVAVWLLIRFRRQASSEQRLLRLVSFGIFWFFITLSVESSIIPIADVIFEHRLYLPSIGAFIAITTSVAFMINRLQRKVKRRAVLVFVLLSVFLAATTYARNSVWRDELTLMQDSLMKSPNSARAWNGVGNYYIGCLQPYMALPYLKQATRINSGYSQAWFNLGFAYTQTGDFASAEKMYQMAVATDPTDKEALIRLEFVRKQLITRKSGEHTVERR